MIRLWTLAGAIVVGLSVRFVLLPAAQRWLGGFALPGSLPPFPKIPTPSLDPWEWFEIDLDNRLHLYCPKIEVGQGVHTLVAQLTAAELGVNLEHIVAHQPDTQRGITGMVNITGGSASVMLVQAQMREAAAKLREMLRGEAAKRLNCTLDQVTCQAGYCVNRVTGERLPFSALVDAIRKQPTSKNVQLKEVSQLALFGQKLPRIDLPEKVTGKAIFGADVRLPRMAYGAVARPPRERARLVEVRNVEQVRTMAGVVAVVVEKNFVGVVAERRSQAWRAVQTLDCTWRGGTTFSDAEIPTAVKAKAGRGAVIQNVGSVHFSQQADIMIAEYRSLITTVGSSFARKHGGLADPSADAAKLSKAVGRPVQLMWTFEEDLRHGPKRPPNHMLFRAALNQKGRITSLEHNIAISDGSRVFPPQDMAPKIIGVDLSGAIGSQPLYSGIPNRRVHYRHVALPILTSFFRTPGTSSNVFGNESFMDELALKAGVDPIDFRLQQYGTRRVVPRVWLEEQDPGGAAAGGRRSGGGASAA